METAGKSASDPIAAPVVPTPRLIVIPTGIFEERWYLLRRAFIASYEDNCFGIAKGAAYSLLLSLFPILTVVAALLIELRAGAIVQVLERFFGQVLPPGTEDLVLSRLRVAHANGAPVIVLLLGWWTGSGALMSIMEGFEAAYHLPVGRPFLTRRGMALLLVLVAAVPAIAASALILSGDYVERLLLSSGEPEEISLPVRLAWRAGRYAVAFCATTAVTGLIYYLGVGDTGTATEVQRRLGGRFKRVWPGAILATTLWLITTSGFAWYVHHLSHYNLFYGSVGTVVLLAVWLYLVACIALLGCEYNAERERNCLAMSAGMSNP